MRLALLCQAHSMSSYLGPRHETYAICAKRTLFFLEFHTLQLFMSSKWSSASQGHNRNAICRTKDLELTVKCRSITARYDPKTTCAFIPLPLHSKLLRK